ncbi:hypothetical protein PGTUg99_026553 [Puccinia graminis f. sp. tritici]|uniref:Uncharacterized protein n=1 Tax=Puccinia graminis f. sp. tritici TaxID=56615 RepID=A0A5B0MD26_PUCGR|nr:hypothetical protein PGTUg99_026553 [Puccinia graminis f. sp. tritici]
MYLVDRKEPLPIKEVDMIGRVSFRSTRYMYLIDRKEPLPIDEVHLPHRPEGNPSGQPGRDAGSQ